MSLVIAGVVIYGFSHTINENLIHPEYPRPLILYLYAVIFTSWVVLLVTQSAFIRTRNHPVYLYGLPMMILGQALTMYISVQGTRMDGDRTSNHWLICAIRWMLRIGKRSF